MSATDHQARPVIAEDTYVHPSAEVHGDVIIGSGCWIGPGARIRADYGRIVIGDCTSIEAECFISAPLDGETSIGNWVTIQHGALVCGSSVKDSAVLGMRSVIADGAIVGEGAEVRNGAAVGKEADVPDGAVVAGVPARVLGDQLDEVHRTKVRAVKRTYVDRARRSPAD